MRFAVPQCLAAPQNFERIVGLSRGLLGLFSGAVLNATAISPRKFEFLGSMLVAQLTRLTSMAFQGRLAVAHRNGIKRKG